MVVHAPGRLNCPRRICEDEAEDEDEDENTPSMMSGNTRGELIFFFFLRKSFESHPSFGCMTFEWKPRKNQKIYKRIFYVNYKRFLDFDYFLILLLEIPEILVYI